MRGRLQVLRRSTGGMMGGRREVIGMLAVGPGGVDWGRGIFVLLYFDLGYG